MFVVCKTLPKKNEKIIQCPFIKSSPFIKIMFFPIKEFIMHLLFKKCKKTHFLNGFSTKICKILNVLNLINVRQYHSPPKDSLQNSTHNLSFEIYLQIFILCDMYFFNTNILHMFKFVNVCWSFFLNKLV